MDWDSQRPSAPSTPTGSVSSQSTGGTGSSRDKVLPYKQLNPSPTVTALAKFSDEELFCKGSDELLRILHRVESDYKNLLTEHSNIVKDVNRRFQIFVLEARGLKEINQKLQDDNQELRDLCCFLDDDRQKSRKLAREWQRFGRYTASVMHSEVAAYQEKLQQLEGRQAELLADNLELKELCLFLDQERNQNQTSADRDDGDGSSNGTMAGHEELTQQSHGDSDGQLTPTPTPSSELSSAYVRQLEQRIQHLEEEKRLLAQKAERNGADGYHPFDQDNAFRPSRLDTDLDQLGHASASRQGATTPGRDRASSAFSVNKPEAVVHAMKVLQVHEQLERPRDPIGTENLGETEKAIVREMCNVVWRKLGDVGEYPPHTAPSSSQPAAGPDQSYRPQSAAGNPHIPSGHPGPPPPARMPTSPHSAPHSPGYHDGQGNVSSSTAATSPGSPGGPPSGAFPAERRSQVPQSSRGHSAQQGTGGGSSVGVGQDPFGGIGKENSYGQKLQGRGGVQQAASYSQPVVPPAAHTAERPRLMQPPPYTGKNPSSAFAVAVPRATVQNPFHQQIPQPHQQPPSSQSQQPPPRYQRRTHPLRANPSQPPPPKQQQLPRSASASTTYYVSQPPFQPRSHSASALQSQQHPAPQHQPGAPSVPGGTYLYAQRSGPPTGGQHSQFKSQHNIDQGSRSSDTAGRPEWKQTYLDD